MRVGNVFFTIAVVMVLTIFYGTAATAQELSIDKTLPISILNIKSSAESLASDIISEVMRDVNTSINKALAKKEIPERELAFETIAKGSDSGITERKNFVITDENEWKNLWNRHVSIVAPAPESPVIDFTKSIVLAVFQGEQRTGGFSIEITKVVETKRTLEVFVKEVSPASNCVVTQALTQPHHIVKVKKVDKDVVFKATQEVKRC